jgi:small subunit ribosomal protein S6
VRTYETVFILDPDLTEDDTEKAIKRVQTVIEGQKGKIALMDRWGKRKLAYRVKKKLKGNYVRVVYYGEPKAVAILERNLRIMEETLKFLTIILAATEIEITTEEKKVEFREHTDEFASRVRPASAHTVEADKADEDTEGESPADDEPDTPEQPQE